MHTLCLNSTPSSHQFCSNFAYRQQKINKKYASKDFFEQCHTFHLMALQPFFECQAITQSKLPPHRVVIYHRNRKKTYISEMEPVFQILGVSINQGPKTPPRAPKTPKRPSSTKNGQHHEKEHTFFNKKLESNLLALAFGGGGLWARKFFSRRFFRNFAGWQ